MEDFPLEDHNEFQNCFNNETIMSLSYSSLPADPSPCQISRTWKKHLFIIIEGICITEM